MSVWNTRNTRDGGEISEFRQLLRDNLPNSINQIVSNMSIPHTTLARFLGTTGTSENARRLRALERTMWLRNDIAMAWFARKDTRY